MSEPRVIRADYANWRPVAGRKVLQLVFEVPIEQTADVLEKLGVPMPGESRWCAVALLEKPEPTGNTARSGPYKADIAASGDVGVTDRKDDHPKDRRPFASLPLSQQAGIRCADKDFALYLMDALPNTMIDTGDAAQTIRLALGISSRAELDSNDVAAGAWDQLESRYQAWRTDRQYGEARR